MRVGLIRRPAHRRKRSQKRRGGRPDLECCREVVHIINECQHPSGKRQGDPDRIKANPAVSLWQPLPGLIGSRERDEFDEQSSEHADPEDIHWYSQKIKMRLEGRDGCQGDRIGQTAASQESRK